LSKLHLHISSLYSSALAQSHIPTDPSSSSSTTSSSSSSEGEVIPLFKRYLRKESILSSALARKWLGVEAGENGKSQKVGEAITWVKDAQMRLDGLGGDGVREKMKGLGIGKGHERRKEERKARKGRVERELEDVAAWLRAYTRMNDTVSYYLVVWQLADKEV
jgi:hypothetical protein